MPTAPPTGDKKGCETLNFEPKWWIIVTTGLVRENADFLKRSHNCACDDLRVQAM